MNPSAEYLQLKAELLKSGPGRLFEDPTFPTAISSLTSDLTVPRYGIRWLRPSVNYYLILLSRFCYECNLPKSDNNPRCDPRLLQRNCKFYINSINIFTHYQMYNMIYPNNKSVKILGGWFDGKRTKKFNKGVKVLGSRTHRYTQWYSLGVKRQNGEVPLLIV